MLSFISSRGHLNSGLMIGKFGTSLSFTILHSFLKLFITCVYVFVYTCTGTCVEVRGKIIGVGSFLPPRMSQGSNLDHEEW